MQARLPRQAPSVLEALGLWYWSIPHLTSGLAASPSIAAYAFSFPRHRSYTPAHSLIYLPPKRRPSPSLGLAASDLLLQEDIKYQIASVYLRLRTASAQPSGLEAFPLRRDRTMVPMVWRVSEAACRPAKALFALGSATSMETKSTPVRPG